MRPAALALVLALATPWGAGACGGRAAAPRPPPPALGGSAAAAPARDPVAAALAGLDEASLSADVAWLTGADLHGRGLFSEDARRTADRIAERFAEAGLEVTRQPITGAADQTNVIGVLPGTGEVVVVCAHYDHLGVMEGATYWGADDNASGTAVLLALVRAHYDHLGVMEGATYWGADDNASGTAVLLALVRAVARTHRGRTVVFLASGAEEAGLLGAGTYVKDPARPLAQTVAMINFDMVGRDFFELAGGRPGALAAVGMESSPALDAAVAAAARAEAVDLIGVTAKTLKFFGFDGRTDDYWFRQNGVAAVHFSTGMHRDYHQPTDTVDKLKPAQMLRVARVAARLLVEVGQLDLE